MSEAATFEEFFLAERDHLLRILTVVTGSTAEAEDIAQEAFLKVWERWDRVREMERPVAFLHVTAMNTFRSRSRRALVAVRRAVGAGPDVDLYARVDERDQVRRLLATLSARRRAALVLTEGLRYSADEAASILGIKASTVRALSFQARRALMDMKDTHDG